MVFLFSVRASDKRIHCDEEFSDSEDEMSGPNESGGRRDRMSHKPKPKRPKTDEERKAEQAKGIVCVPNTRYLSHCQIPQCNGVKPWK
ncbi:hypothetical protein DPMN_040065 [Dreissena polymorpha]|uniref:Uncharacterized protein n=1 Tax=Dreissena polymorpha TaxID=45954 RepID=A0A9D4CUC5_DREPO|nr:hypothetical protein DPMN_040065 [Dreissena polymorpha]